MTVASKRHLSTQLLVEIDGKLFLTKQKARSLSNDRWELTFRKIGNALPAVVPNQPRYLTGIGFTPLEKDGRYGIEVIEVFIDSLR